MVRGIFSPPRSRSSFQTQNNEPKPPSLPNYMLPLGRTVAENHNEKRSHRNVAGSRNPTVNSRNEASKAAVRGKLTGKTSRAADTRVSSRPTVARNIARNIGERRPNEHMVVGKVGDYRNGCLNDEQVVVNSDGNGKLHHSLSDSSVYDQMNRMHGTEIKRRNSDRVDYVGKTLIYDDDIGDSKVDLLKLPGKKLGATSSQTLLSDDAEIVDNDNSANGVGSDVKKNGGSKDVAGPVRLFQIYKDIASHHQGTLSVTSYLTKLEKFWDELSSHTHLPNCSCGEHGVREKVMQFLMGLNDSYSTLCAQILLMHPFPTIEIACSLILREEKERELAESLAKVTEKLLQSSWH